MQRIWEYAHNVLYGQTGYSPELESFVADNNAWTNAMIATAAGSDPHWYQVSLLIAQQKGMYAGFAVTTTSEQNLSFAVFEAINLAGEIG